MQLIDDSENSDSSEDEGVIMTPAQKKARQREHNRLVIKDEPGQNIDATPSKHKFHVKPQNESPQHELSPNSITAAGIFLILFDSLLLFTSFNKGFLRSLLCRNFKIQKQFWKKKQCQKCKAETSDNLQPFSLRLDLITSKEMSLQKPWRETWSYSVLKRVVCVITSFTCKRVIFSVFPWQVWMLDWEQRSSCGMRRFHTPFFGIVLA